MKLSECLNTADINTLRGIAEYYDLPCSRHSKMALIQEISFAYRNSAFTKEWVPKWQAGRGHAMMRMCLDQRTVFSVEELEGMMQFCEKGSDTIASAVREGWLYPTTRLNGRLMYCIPDEMQLLLRQNLVSRFQDRVQTSDEGPLTYQEEEYAAIRDLDVFLEYVRHHDVKLTTDGSIYKRNLQQVLELLEVDEEVLQGGWRFGYGRRFHDYPDRLALIYDFAYHHHYLEEAEDGFLRVTEEAMKWTDMTELARLGGMVRFYLSLYRRPIKRLPQIVQLVAHVATRWIQSDSMLEAVDMLVNEYYYDTKAQVWSDRILKMLRHLGVIRVGTDEDNVTWFQITKLGQQLLTPDAIPGTMDEAKEKQKILIVQPNFEIVVTADQPMVTAELALYTEIKQTGVIRVYRITEETVQRGMQSGKTVSAWLEFLQRFSQTPVPGNVERTLKEWERTFGGEVHEDTVGL